jgi:hypothetical protein
LLVGYPTENRGHYRDATSIGLRLQVLSGWRKAAAGDSLRFPTPLGVGGFDIGGSQLLFAAGMVPAPAIVCAPRFDRVPVAIAGSTDVARMGIDVAHYHRWRLSRLRTPRWRDRRVHHQLRQSEVFGLHMVVLAHRSAAASPPPARRRGNHRSPRTSVLGLRIFACPASSSPAARPQGFAALGSHSAKRALRRRFRSGVTWRFGLVAGCDRPGVSGGVTAIMARTARARPRCSISPASDARRSHSRPAPRRAPRRRSRRTRLIRTFQLNNCSATSRDRGVSRSAAICRRAAVSRAVRPKVWQAEDQVAAYRAKPGLSASTPAPPAALTYGRRHSCSNAQAWQQSQAAPAR